MREQTTRAAEHEAGFTLIEMVLVIALLGILAAIAVFSHDRFADRAREMCDSNNSRIEVTVNDAQNISEIAYGDYFDIEPGDCYAPIGAQSGTGPLTVRFG